MPTPKDERRQHTRIFGSVIEYSYVDLMDYCSTAFVKDISLGGICIYVHEDIPERTQLLLFVHLFENEMPVETKGEVVWKKNSNYFNCFDIGIKFIDISLRGKEELTKYIKRFGKNEEVEPAPSIELEENVNRNGFHWEYYDTKELLSEVNIVNNKMEGLKKYYYKSSEILEELNFKNGKRDGVRRCYRIDGSISIEQEFRNGKSVKLTKFDKEGNIIYKKL